ncbi:MAG: TOBE domain-containing protein, partial [Pseudomonadota bacterium]
IVRNPKIFLFDEPLSNLDAALRGDMRVELAQLHQNLDATMVYVTHDQVEAMTMADRIVVLKDGVVEQFGTPMQLYHHPETRFVASFIGQPNMNFVPATVLGKSASGLGVELDGGLRLELPVATDGVSEGDTLDVGLRPEDVVLAENGDGLPMHVNVLERLGGHSVTYGTVGNGVKFCAALDGNTMIQQGGDISLSVAPETAHAFASDGRVLRRMRAPAIANT